MPRFNPFLLPSKLRRRARRSRIFTMLLILALLCTLLGPFYLIYKPPHLLIRYFAHRWPDVLWHVPLPQKSRVIALTIDDAPSEYTRQILDVLSDNGATATFFVIGSQVQGRQEVLREVLRNGNELGNHAMKDEPSRSLSTIDLVEQIEQVEEMIKGAYLGIDPTGESQLPKYFRPGSGFFNLRMRTTLRNMGYRLILGGIYPHDPQISFWRVNAAHILSMIRPGGIIICHDRRSWTIPMLKRVLPELRRRGYRVVTVTKLLEEGHS